MNDQQLREFLAEADERVETLFADVERLRGTPPAEGRTQRALIARIFRHVHTLKGSASTMPRLAALNRLAHEFENLLDAVRSGRAPLTDAAVDACEDATNALSLVLERAARGDATAETPAAVLAQLRHHAATAGANAPHDVAETLHANARAVPDALPGEMGRDLSAVERRNLSESVREGASVLVLAAAFDLATLDEHFGRFADALGECGEIISTFPGDPAATAAAAPDRISFRFLYTHTCAHAELEARLAPFGARIEWAGGEPEIRAAREADDGDTARASVTGVASGDETSGVEARGDEPGEAGAPVFVRVPLRELDELVTATHDLFTDTLAMLEGTEAAPGAARARRLREDFGALEERVMALRMQPLMPVLERAARAARIAARAAGKEIEMEVAGGEVRVDRSLAEQIGEPLLHLLRNAIDHGIETPEERRAAGKPARGRVRLEVGAEGSRVRVRVADDGRGVDAGRVARSAVAQGLLPAGAAITEEQALRLIFRPGFSTAGRVSDVSGRGVGLDVVEHALERAGGELRVRTTSGEGTTFEVRVPLTLALVTVVVVRSRGYAYAFDASHVVATGRVEPEDIACDEAGRLRALWQGEQLPFVSLRSLLEGATAGASGAHEPSPACVVRRERDGADAWRGEGAPEQFIIGVDKIEGEREALVRTLGRHATRWRGVSGAFEQRDGTVALLLDLPRLL